MRRIALFATAVFWINLAFAGLPDEWKKAEQAYAAGQVAEAAKAYERLLAQGYRSAELYYNLGNCYARLERDGRAVLAYERALRLSPGDEMVALNLEIVRNRLEDQIEGLAEYPLLQRIRNPQYLWPSGVWSSMGMALFWVALVLWLWSRRVGKQSQTVRLSLSVMTAAGVLLAATGVYSYFRERDWREAIVMERQIALHIAPDAQSPEARNVHEGAKVFITGTMDHWYKVRLENGDEGWLKRNQVESVGVGNRE
ncbi:MAG: tetratricopeptide repeat protein [Haliscomenobacter sp.]|nr:tetratricopeptide repeat protein [Haliscomenobacter sp.]